MTTLVKRSAADTTKPERVEQLMSRSVATCRPDDYLERAAQIMWERDCGVVPVTVLENDGERVVGMITDRDVCMAAYTQGRALADVPVSIAMSGTVQACGPTDRIDEALGSMAAAQLHRLAVIDAAGRLVGLLSFADVAREEARNHKVVAPEDLANTLEAITKPRPHELMVAS